MNRKRIRRLLIANRGEIAVRVIRACRELGITSVAVFSDPDRTSRHVLMADEAYALGGTTTSESYLNRSRIIERLRETDIDAVHPGYGFFSENPEFAASVEQLGIKFIGPGSTAIRTLGNKTSARQIALQVGVPVIQGSQGHLDSAEAGLSVAEQIGFPVLLKASGGGGGKGMRVIRTKNDFQSAFEMARSEARNAFGDDRIFLEKYLEHPRHVEIQILADEHGSIVYLGERECSIQRRHQKVIEESPSPIMDSAMRKAMGEAAVKLARAGGYTNAGTVEFLVDQNRAFYFLEMNTRLQVEHPVTESVTGIDLVKEQIRIAEGETLSLKQDEIKIQGHAIECRIYAEDPGNSFLPSTGTLWHYIEPQGARVRVESGVREGDRVTVYYDPLLAKVVSWGETREESLLAMRRALDEFVIAGVRSTIPFCLFVLNHPNFMQGDFATSFVEQHYSPESLLPKDPGEVTAAAVGGLFMHLRRSSVAMGNHAQPTHERNAWKRLRLDQLR